MNQMKILELESITTKVKNSVDSFNSRLERAEERISEHEDRSEEIIQFLDLESVIQSEVSQKEENKYYRLTHINGI